MRRNILLCLCMLISVWVKAQILKDSTVQVVAYWEKGESYKYRYYKEEFKVEGNDTIWGDTTDEIFRIEVVDTTGNGYLMKYQCLQSEHRSEDDKLQAIMKTIEKKYGEVPIYFTTNQHGAFTDIARWDEYQLTVDSVLSDVRKGMMDYFRSEEGSDTIPEEVFQMMDGMIDQIILASKNKDVIKLGMSYIISPLYYHGAKMEQNREYSGKEKFMSPWIPGELVDGVVTLQVDKVDYETSWTTFHRTQSYEAGQLMDSFMRYLTQTLPPEHQVDLKPDELPFVMIETFFDLDVHLNTGWPGAAFFKKTVQTGDKQKVERWWLDLVFDE